MAAPESKTLQNLNGNWTVNQSLSDDPSPALELQGVNVLLRKAASSATVHLQVSQPSKDKITMKQSVSAAKLPGTSEDYTLNWEWSEHSDPVFGELVSRARWISVEDAKKEGARGDWIEGDSEGMVIQAESKKEDGSWGGVHFWGFETVDGERRHTRRVRIWEKDGEEKNMKIVYDFDGE